MQRGGDDFMVDLENRTILQGDVLEKLKTIPNNNIDCIISSPPYLMGIKRLWC